MSPEPTRIAVGGDRPYDVVVGRSPLGDLRGMLGDGVAKVAVIHPRALHARAEPSGTTSLPRAWTPT